MKMKVLGNKKPTAAVSIIPVELLNKLNGKTVNQALEEGLLTEVGDDNGDFIKRHATVDRSYALFGNMAIQLSEGANSSITDETTNDELGELTFARHMSLVKIGKDGQVDEENGDYVEVWRLQLPRTLNLGDTVKAINATEVTV